MEIYIYFYFLLINIFLHSILHTFIYLILVINIGILIQPWIIKGIWKQIINQFFYKFLKNNLYFYILSILTAK